MRIYKINLLTFFVIQSRLKTIDLTKVINKINKTRLCIKNSYISRKKNEVNKKADLLTHATSNLGKGVEQKQSDYQPKIGKTEKN